MMRCAFFVVRATCFGVRGRSSREDVDVAGMVAIGSNFALLVVVISSYTSALGDIICRRSSRGTSSTRSTSLSRGTKAKRRLRGTSTAVTLSVDPRSSAARTRPAHAASISFPGALFRLPPFDFRIPLAVSAFKQSPSSSEFMTSVTPSQANIR